VSLEFHEFIHKVGACFFNDWVGRIDFGVGGFFNLSGKLAIVLCIGIKVAFIRLKRIVLEKQKCQNISSQIRRIDNIILTTCVLLG